MENIPEIQFDQYCFFIHRLKLRSTLNYRTKLPTLAKDQAGSPLIVKIAKELNDASESYNTFYYSEKAKNLAEINIEELTECVNNYVSLLGGFVGGSKLFQLPIVQPDDNEVIVVAGQSNNHHHQHNNHSHDDDEDGDSTSKMHQEEGESTTNHSDNEGDEEKKDNDDKEDKEEEEFQLPKISGTTTTTSSKSSSSSTSSSMNDSIRKNLQFQWGTIFGTERICKSSDVVVELISVLMNLGVWYLGYSEFLVSKSQTTAGSDSIDEEQRKVVYDYLLKAAGIFEWIMEKTPTLGLDLAGVNILDFNSTILRALYLQSIGQAQEISIGRAFKKNTSRSIITKLAVDTASIYGEIGSLLEGMDQITENRLERFMLFCRFKQQLYRALAINQQAYVLNQTHQYGAAIATGNQSRELVKKALTLIRPLACITLSVESMKLPITVLQKMIEADQTRFERENKVIGFQTVPDQTPDLPEGNRLAKARPFVLPMLSPLWDSKTFDQFDSSRKLSETDINSLIVQSPSSSSTSNSPVLSSKDKDKDNDYININSKEKEKDSNNNSSPKSEKKECLIN
ncbi:hypothetical protein DFA_11998 [Cavenderia fasciculata]|uniref:BRO1 domain-containing protein n=1 Tax=Cavenderia fasciculata TaxID=261658 RepID=F4QF74_CACFS|nr:uncharacterized protein DFA_11998 [Cavenderia fasciculata]EGG14228.1 hypothetical protein DFA_11998 [Cavenderia fasciculata]|eukprot:XP_004350937.1 hypothetical protein DFA_11998 [Cavenderia fasciculata]